MARLVPYIFSEDARSQAQFYVDALGGELLSVMTFGDVPGTPEALKEKIMHLHLVAGGITILMSDSPSRQIVRGNGTALSLLFDTPEEAHAAFDKLSAGGNVQDPLKQQFWGALFGVLQDKYGVEWQVSTEQQQQQQQQQQG
ncbi:VOC family protein [Cohnella hashimotonis]|uniref:VOC family protein n=1 Tax=Cohnella hashimotonis TaxID=2826895 RepID=A0ABT6TBE1_9BACL|nr:VOC family protein [Cohnella hashimotonis]MDI4643891.1 VOC family protein [Cohnella hashimotonis]